MNEEDFTYRLTPQQFHIMREGGTEAPFSGKLLREKRNGRYSCGACGNELFSNEAKYDSGSGWPSFYEALKDEAIILEEDTSLGVHRIEVQCAQCRSHLGHVFADGPQPTGQRYCINSAALDFKAKNEKKESE